MMDEPSAMMQHRGMWLPAGEHHLQPHLDRGPMVDGRGTYQLHKLQAALAVLPEDRAGTAVDIGAHVGLWSRVLAPRFRRLEAFEPIPWHRACWARNMAGVENAYLHPYAASDTHGTLWLQVDAGNSGNTRVSAEGGQVEAQAIRVDDLWLGDVDFVKADCEGWEQPALQGMVRTIQRTRPVIIVEQKPGHAERAGLAPLGAVQFLVSSFQYRLHLNLGGDYIMVPPDNPAWGAATVP